MRYIKTKKTIKGATILLSLLLPIVVYAQGGLFQRGEKTELHRSDGSALLTNQGFGNPLGGIVVTNQAFSNPTGGVDVTNQTFGAPLGSGIITLLIASAGYTALKSGKRNNENRKENIK